MGKLEGKRANKEDSVFDGFILAIEVIGFEFGSPATLNKAQTTLTASNASRRIAPASVLAPILDSTEVDFQGG
jgi:hypothetical protein